MKLKVKNKLNPLKIVNSADVAELWIYGDIVDDTDGGWRKYWGEEGFTCPADVREELDSIGDKPVNIYIASDGGNVNAGLAIANIIQRLKGKTTAYIDSWAASIASVIALACDAVVMPDNTFIMIHNPAGGCIGTAKDMRDYADLLDVVRDSIIKVYETNSEKTAEDFIKLMDAESWLTAKQASELWNHISVVEATNKTVAVVSNYEKAPETVKEVVKKDYSELIAKAEAVLQ